MFLLFTSRELLTQTDVTLQELAEEEMNMEYEDFTQRESAKFSLESASSHTQPPNTDQNRILP